MTRVMIDTTHDGLPAALPVIRALHAGNLVALYDTGSPGIAATPADIGSIPSALHTVMIDQGFTGSPNLKANIRDCENGAWSVSNAVNKNGWNVLRPMLYLGYPDTAQEAADAGWKGDVWLVHASVSAPTVPPSVPRGLNVVAVQWNFANPNYDESVVFDTTWPEGKTVPTSTTLNLQSGWAWCNKCQGLFWAEGMAKSVCPAGGHHENTGSSDYVLVAESTVVTP